MSKPTRVYTSTEVTVEWYPERCIHCQNCIEELPEVFNLDNRPWVSINATPQKRSKRLY
jgi:uncharacterized Fe-S cluster protein YjdI